MKDFRCPFCWGEHIIQIDDVFLANSESRHRLMECVDCEKFYLEDSGEEVTTLSDICLTKNAESENCFEDLRAPFKASIYSNPKQKKVEFNLICSECPKRNFVVKEGTIPFKGRVSELFLSVG